MVTNVLVLVGALNWGLVGFFDFNLVSALVGAWPVVERVVYALVGLSAVYLGAMKLMCCSKKSECKEKSECKDGSCDTMGGMKKM